MTACGTSRRTAKNAAHHASAGPGSVSGSAIRRSRKPGRGVARRDTTLVVDVIRVRSPLAGATHAVELAAKVLAGPALAADDLDAGRDLCDEWWRAPVDVALGGGGRADARLDRLDDLDDPL